MTYTPCYFDETELTGSGGRTGLLNDALTTACYSGRSPIVSEHCRSTVQNGMVTVDVYPISLLPRKIWPEQVICPISADDPDWMCIASDCTSRLLIRLDIQNLTLEKIKNPFTGKQSRNVYTQWRLLWCLQSEESNLINISFTYDVPRTIHRLLQKAVGLVPDQKQLEILLHQTVYDYLCRASRNWHEEVVQAADFGLSCTEMDKLEAACLLAENLTNYKVSMDDCFALIRYLRVRFPAGFLPQIVSKNLYLLLSSILEDLHTVKGSLMVPPEAMLHAEADPFFSPAQKAVIESFSPLMLVQSVAGSGKSTVVNGRINHLMASGVRADDIMVLSFTNAAADHIKELNPDLKSMTIDSMASELYKANFPDQKDVPAETLANALEAMNSENPVCQSLTELLRQAACNQKGAEFRLFQLLKENLQEVTDCLQSLQMVCLQLKPMICYLLLDSLYIPESVQAFFLIVDEVQDNSIFQHILILSYVMRFRVNLMMVGDGSQTLYEWRNSDPQALNALEASGIFDTYQLTCNFRSNQNILDFANSILDDIEANAYARLQLYAFDQNQNCRNAVTPCVIPIQSSDDYWASALMQSAQGIILPWLQQQIQEGRQTCLLVSSHREIDFIKSLLDCELPSPILDISSVHAPATTIFSKFVNGHLDDIYSLPCSNFSASLVECIAARVINLKAAVYQRRDLNQWLSRNAESMNRIAAAYQSGNLDREEFGTLIRRNLLDFEADLNIRKTEYRSRKNAEMKSKENLENQPVLISTVHSAKGLEFDSAVVLIKEKLTMNEADKRTAYVALTRAKEREMVLIFTQKPDSGFSKMLKAAPAAVAAAAEIRP